MNLKIKNHTIIKNLEKVKGGVANNSNLLILTFVLIQTKKQKLTITTTNSEIEIQTKTNIPSEQEAEFTLCLIDLINILSKLNEEEEIEFQIEKSQVTIKANKSIFKLNTIEKNQFNHLTTKKILEKSLTISKQKFINIINKTKFSIANNNPHIYLNGLFLKINKNEILAVSSDGHRLSLAKTKQQNNIIDKKIAIIPKKTIEETLKILNETKDDDTKVQITDEYFSISNNTTKLTSKLISGNYPDYEQIIPKESNNIIIINNKDFYKAIKQAEVFTKDTNTIKLVFEKNQLTIKASSEKGRAKTELTTKNFNGNLEIGFNSSYLTQVLQKIETENVILKINNDEQKILVLTNEGFDEYKYIVMSVKI